VSPARRPAHAWDPDRYLAHADERGRPFVELVARVGHRSPRTVVDLGCGPGNLTELLAQRWPGAEVVGVDSSPEMVGSARARGGAVRYEVGDARDWTPSGPVDVLVSNAMLQWVPRHLELLPRLVECVAEGGWLAFQVPGNMDEPSHVLRRALAAEAPYSEHTRGVAEPASHDPEVYLRALQAAGCPIDGVDAWESTYLHVLHGEDPVLSWISGTSLRPTLQALPEELRPLFTAELGERLREAYPPDELGGGAVLLPFRRVFVVARR
jgi:trans-aconitate 2-methyltransferase